LPAVRRGTPAYALRPHHHAVIVITVRADRSLVTQGWVADKPCFVTFDTGAYVTVARLDTAAGLPERQSNQRYTLQTSGEALPILKKVFLTQILGRGPLKMWVFFANITNEFIWRLDICAHAMHLWT
jgi:hypothetical protein